jgi:deoxyhypusine synthase
MTVSTVSAFLKEHFRHFNAAALMDAAAGYSRHLDTGGSMLMTLAGAMSTAELGRSLAEMIRQGKVQGIACTGANLEEDVFNLVAHKHYTRVPNYRDLTPADEQKLLERHMNRVTDTCIPEAEAMRRIERAVLEEWVKADREGKRCFPHEFMYRILRSGTLKSEYEIDPKDSWLLAAAERDLPMFVPGWEDSTLGNMYAGHCISGDVCNVHTVRTGIEYMIKLADWYQTTSATSSIAHAAPRSAAARGSTLGLLLPDLGFHDVVRVVLRGRPQREDHLGQAWCGHAQVHHRVRRLDRRAPHVRARTRLVARAYG